MKNTASNAIPSSYPNYGANMQGIPGGGRTLYQFGVAPRVDENIASFISVGPQDETLQLSDQSVGEFTIRRLNKDIDQAKVELKELEETVVEELLAPSVREWLFPLMAIGLALSLYGSFSAANTTEMGATGLLLLWSLSAFWFIYARDRRLEIAQNANKAEMEIWTSRIEELEKVLEQKQRVVESDTQ